MPRYKLTIEYDGTGLVGWQRQPNGPSVQEILETAVERLTGQRCFVQGAGRTDAGVHATGQVAHVDLDRPYRAGEIQGALNYHMKPAAVCVLAVELASDHFHARLSAIHRAYVYRILNRRAPPAIERNHVWHVPVALDLDAMIEGAAHLVGHHDFTSFRATMCQARSPVKTLDRLTITRVGEEIHVVPEARSFLHHQVRNIVGTLKLVGSGQWRPDEVKRALDARDRAAAGPTAPPDGLYLTAVHYPDEALLEQAGGQFVDAEADDDVE
ncbi:MAG TPA: tRNA pseudouridine(38-40) synthase TruA [Aliidongia sp.]|uniref:tRNA pseudouridine(38-40) synthase TruA n=1 Tax=Aliidongia sp. TaxID=1914230 RepID=UPI002DDD6567|nr:tRNA pseudouridine(38-40) synthase TruA [Aliidongia sp.]HEV2675799.1 tRNA pseudouridine(38-40) synthase TruA [Aliidongia sp.]